MTSKIIFGNRTFNTICLFLFFLGISCSSAKAQFNINEKEITVFPVPAFGYSPETKTYVGAVTLFTFRDKQDTLTRTSNAKIEFNYTWNKQIILESEWNWFSPEEKWFSSGVIHYSKYPDLFYEIGFDTPASNEMNLESNRFILDFSLFRNIKKSTFIGGNLNFTSYSNINFIKENELRPSSDLKNFGIKAIYLFDSRNSILSPTQGNYFKFSNSFNFATSFYYKPIIDYRSYFSWGQNDSHVIAGRLYHESVFGDPPFYDFPMVGGDEYLRGYYLGRFRDKNLSLVQLEYRIQLFWRIGMAAFGGSAVIYDKINNIVRKSFKPNAGVGLRFLVDKNEQTYLRFDYAVGVENQTGFYVSFGESF